MDQISVYRKMTVFERPGERVMVLMTAGNLAVSQAVLDGLARQQQEGGETLWNAPDMFEAARRMATPCARSTAARPTRCASRAWTSTSA